MALYQFLNPQLWSIKSDTEARITKVTSLLQEDNSFAKISGKLPAISPASFSSTLEVYILKVLFLVMILTFL